MADPQGETSGGVESDREKYVTLETISELAWETHRAWEKILGEPPTLPWDNLSASRQREIMDGVRYILDNPHQPVFAQHDFWRATQHAKSPMALRDKQIDNFLDYEYLKWSQQMKARLYRHIVHAIVG